MVRCSGSYLGNLRIETRHEESGVKLITDAPKDIQGMGGAFSPTDLAAVSLATCILTTIAIVAERDQISIDGTTYSVEKYMSTDLPRKIDKIKIDFYMPKSIPVDKREKLEKCATACPVHRSLKDEVIKEVSFYYK